MAKVRLQVWGYRCERCSHEWIPRDFDIEPRVCPKCKSPYWNRPRKRAAKGTGAADAEAPPKGTGHGDAE